MKKKILGGFVVTVIAAVAAFNINFNMNESTDLASGISLANVNALAQDESPNKTKGTVYPCFTYEDGVLVGTGNTCAGSNTTTCYSNPCL